MDVAAADTDAVFYANCGADYAEAASSAAQKLCDEINICRKSKSA